MSGRHNAAVGAFAVRLDSALIDLERQLSTLDPEARALASMEAYGFVRDGALPQLASIRRGAVRDLRSQGYTLKECAEMLGVTDARIAQITGA